MKHRAVVLGCGMVGAAMARDLAADADYDVTVVDINPENLRRVGESTSLAAKAGSALRTERADVSQPETLRATVDPFDIVIGALPSRIGLQSLRAVIEAGKPYADISFMPQDALQLDGLAKERGVTAVVDCGVAPGLSNFIVGYLNHRLDAVQRAVIYAGGLPKARQWPFYYKAPFAPADVIEEYTRPARFVENGLQVTKPALSDPELVDFPRVGTLEAFNTDGLRTLLATVDIPNMTEKTLRYPGHLDLMRTMRESGFFRSDLLDVGGMKVRPIDVTSALIFPAWKYEEDEEEFTVLRVVVEGQQEGEAVRYTYDLYDEYDRATGTSSMARTTAFPNVITARMIVQGMIREPGVHPPELLARRPGVFEHVIEELAKRGVHLEVRREP